MPTLTAPSTTSAVWNRPHLLGLQGLSPAELRVILDRAAEFKRLHAAGHTKLDHLKGVTVGNLFFEASTRTKTSFGLAAKRLSADTVDFTASGSSLSKGETFIDTARNIEAMGVTQMVVRHSTSGAPHHLAKHLNAGIINAGDGTHEHPTQGLLDIFTIQEHRGQIAGLTVALVGDILHSRVARSNIWGLTTLGAKVIVCGELKRKVTLSGLLASKGAKAAVEAAGGKIEMPATADAPKGKGKKAAAKVAAIAKAEQRAATNAASIAEENAKNAAAGAAEAKPKAKKAKPDADAQPAAKAAKGAKDAAAGKKAKKG